MFQIDANVEVYLGDELHDLVLVSMINFVSKSWVALSIWGGV